ncbi:hypothetical protein SXCC_00478 [Gluconacetobacter sp. SXCC-1]|nr:hypothetical protein SXCC_00478 [Gluconacetobacter sp. SXCC-1]
MSARQKAYIMASHDGRATKALSAPGQIIKILKELLTKKLVTPDLR